MVQHWVAVQPNLNQDLNITRSSCSTEGPKKEKKETPTQTHAELKGVDGSDDSEEVW